MGDLETRMGGSRESFPETAWSSIRPDAEGGSARRKDAMSRLCATYWRPVYKTLRVSWNKPVEDAKDLTQEFFRTLLDDDAFMERFDPGRGRFRHFLKGALHHFMTQTLRDGAALKRGGGAATIALDVAAVEAESFLSDERGRSADEVFDRQWADEVLARAIDRLRRELEAGGRPEVFRAYEAFDMAPADAADASYESIAARLGLPLAQVKNGIEAARSRLRKILMDVIADGVSSREDLLDEFRELFAG